MFTGIIETVGKIQEISESGTNKSFWISCSLKDSFKIDQSVSHDGVCLTVDDLDSRFYRVTAIAETLGKTNLNDWEKDTEVNVERSLKQDSRFDGHIVQGHADTVANCIEKKELNGSWNYRFSFPEKFAGLIIEKGSIALNGVSLTIFDISLNEFTVGIIPYTFEHTNIRNVVVGTKVNIEFDMIGKYIARLSDQNVRQASALFSPTLKNAVK